MARKLRISSGDCFYHVINRANARFKVFEEDADFLMFELLLIEASQKFLIDILTHTIMTNHFHLVIYSKKDKELSKFMHWLCTTFAQRWHKKRDTVGTGHIFQGRYKSFIIKNERHLLQVLLYADRNAVRGGLVEKAEDWRWSALWIRIHGNKEQKKMLKDWPIEVPDNYIELVNQKDDRETLQKIRFAIDKEVEIDFEVKKKKRGRPYKK